MRTCVKEVSIIIENGFSLPVVAGITEIFKLANNIINSNSPCDPEKFNVRLFSAEGGEIRSSSLVSVTTENIEAYDASESVHALFIENRLRKESFQYRQHPASGLSRFDRETSSSLPCFGGWLLPGLAQEKWSTLQIGHESNPLQVALIVACADISPDLGRLLAEQLDIFSAAPSAQDTFNLDEQKISKPIRAAIEYIKTNCDQHILTSDLAQVAAMSTRNFIRRFKLEIGASPSEYIGQVRLDRICSLLLDTDLPIDKIAHYCGFNGGGSLAKFFQKNMASTPKEYRLRNKKH
jgi:transcriptional regulator GlxA family with amidase domain